MYVNNFLWENLSHLSDLLNGLQGAVPDGTGANNAALIRRLIQPGCNPLEDIFLAWVGDSLAGYAEVHREREISRAVITGGVRTNFSRQGIGSALIHKVQSHTKILELRTLHIDVHEEHHSTLGLLRKHGFEHIRTHLHLQRKPTVMNSENLAPQANLEIRLIKDDEFQDLTRLQNEVFEGSWGFCPNSLDQIRYRVLDLHDDPDPVMILLAQNNMEAYCWAHIEGPGRPAQLGMLGVSVGYRGKGFGRLVTIAAIEHLLHFKPSHINITVDSQNIPAIQLYKDLGFKLDHSSHWMESPRT